MLPYTKRVKILENHGFLSDFFDFPDMITIGGLILYDNVKISLCKRLENSTPWRRVYLGSFDIIKQTESPIYLNTAVNLDLDPVNIWQSVYLKSV